MKYYPKYVVYILLFAAVILMLWFLYFGNMFSGHKFTPDIEKIKSIQIFISGIVMPLLTFATTLLIIETFSNTTLQNISGNFFKLIDQHKNILEGVNSDTSHLQYEYIKSTGKDFFDDLCERITDDFNAFKNNDIEYLKNIDESLYDSAHNKSSKDLLMKIYDHYYQLHQSDLGHYFRNLYYIVRYIEKSNIRKSQKTEFIKMLRSQLSNYELLLLAYNGLSSYGEKFYTYIEKYHLLKSLNNETKLPNTYKNRIIDIDILKNAYPHLKNYW
jgi:hypothetical protein